MLLAALSVLDYERLFGKLSFVPLLASFALSVLLVLFGYGPGHQRRQGEPVRLSAGGDHPRAAGVFPGRILRAALGRAAPRARNAAARWRALTARFDIPPVEYTLPVLVSVALSLAFFFLQKDMGPALVFACLFLVLYGIARGSAFVPAAGLALLVGGLRGRLSARRAAHGAASASRCGFRPGTTWCTAAINWRIRCGPSPPADLPAWASGWAIRSSCRPAHTDLILSALGEEWGFLGVAAVFALYAFLIVSRASASRCGRAPTTNSSWPPAWRAATALQILLIAGGALGVLPLSGVVTPFLSYGRTAMLANFVVFAILLSISRARPRRLRSAPRRSVVAACDGAGPGLRGALAAVRRWPKPPTCRCCAAART